MKTKTAILLGATGLTGNLLLQQLLKDDDFQKIILFSRSSVKLQHSKLEEHLSIYFNLKTIKSISYRCSFAVEPQKLPNKTYRKVDFGIQVTAKTSQQNNIPMIVVSAIGADKNSRFFYNKTKGEMEEAVLAEKIAETYILRPSLIDDNRDESRPFELAWKKVMRLANFIMIGPLKNIAPSKQNHCKRDADIKQRNNPKSIIESEEIKEIVTGVN